jgi:hypothetical protein
MKPGRKNKSAKGSYRYTWHAKAAAQYLRAALEIMRLGDPYDGRPEFDEACRLLGRYLCEGCGDDPLGFMRMIADELKGRLMHSPADENYCRAWLKCVARNINNGLRRYPMFQEWKNELPCNGSLPADSSLRRSMTRLGLSFCRARPPVPK